MINSTFGGFMTARLGMAASQHGLNLTGHNLTNSATKGYTRQRIDQVSINYSGTYRYASKYNVNVGNGVLVKGISQLRDPFLDLRFRNETAHVGYEEIKKSVYGDLADILDEVKNSKEDAISGGGIFNQLGSILEKFQQLSNEVGNKEFDNMVKTACQQLTTLLNSYSKRIDEVQNNLTNDLKNVDVPRVNEILKSISELNKSIKSSEIHGEGALELKDERNLLIDELSKYMKIKVTYTPVQISDSTWVDELKISMVNGNDPDKPYTLVDDQQYRQLDVKQDGNQWNVTLTEMKPQIDPDVAAALESAKRVLAKATAQNDPYQLAEDFKAAHNTFSKAIGELQAKQNAHAAADTAYTKAQEKWTKTNNDLIAARGELSKLQADKNTPKADLDAKKAEVEKFANELATAAQERSKAKETLNTAQKNLKQATSAHADAQKVYEDALNNLPTDLNKASFPGAKKDNINLRNADPNAPMLDADGNVSATKRNYAGLIDDQGAAIKTNLLTGAPLTGGNGAIQQKYEDAVKKFDDAQAAYKASEDAGKNPADANGPIVMNDLFTDGKLRGTLEMLNKKGDYDDPVSGVRGIGYYKNMLDTFANTFANEMNKLNGTDKPLFTNSKETDPTKLATGITAGNIRVAEKWMNNDYNITASTTSDPATGGGPVKGANDNILRFIMLFDNKDVTYKTELDSGLDPNNPQGKQVFKGTFEEAFTNIGVTLGLDIKGTSEKLDNYEMLASSISAEREGVTGVNLDEEAMHIMQYTQSYNASARLMTALDEMLNTLISNTGVVGR